VIHRIHKFVALPYAQQALLVWSLAVVALVRVKLLWGGQSWRLPPFRRLSRHRTSRYSPGQIAWAVTVASSYVPNASCLVQALAAEFILSRTGHASRLHIGVAPDKPRTGRSLDAHAWLECDGQVLLGGAGADRYRSLFTRDGASE
jgi:hypothetical protein